MEGTLADVEGEDFGALGVYCLPSWGAAVLRPYSR
jgi:hypothetical protein